MTARRRRTQERYMVYFLFPHLEQTYSQNTFSRKNCFKPQFILAPSLSPQRRKRVFTTLYLQDI
jgi:hypothetical protein